jgi:hypothetical protein
MIMNFQNKLNKIIFKQICKSKIFFYGGRIWVIDEKTYKWYFSVDTIYDQVWWNDREFKNILKILNLNWWENEYKVKDFIMEFFSILYNELKTYYSLNKKLNDSVFLQITTSSNDFVYRIIGEGKSIIQSYEEVAPPEPGN